MERDSRNPYAPPGANVERQSPAPIGATGSLEEAVAGNYEFSIGEIMSEAWGLLPGFKGPVWGAVLFDDPLFFLVGIVLVFALVGGGGGDAPASVIWLQIFNAILGIIMMPLIMGVVALGVRHASGLPVSFTMAFGYFRKAPVLIAAALLVTLLTYLGIALLILPGIYLGLAYGMTLPLLMFNDDLSIWRAMETSRRAITHHWFGFFVLYIVMCLLMALSGLLLLIPLIWTLPWAVLIAGVSYRRMFGVPPVTE